MSREKDRQFSNLNPKMLNLAEIREEAYRQGRADAVDEFIEAIFKDMTFIKPTEEQIRRIAEQTLGGKTK